MNWRGVKDVVEDWDSANEKRGIEGKEDENEGNLHSTREEIEERW